MIAFLREQSLHDDLMAPCEIIYQRQTVKMVDLADSATINYAPTSIVIDNLSLIGNFTWSHEIILEALLSEESNHQYVDIDDPNDVLKILCGSKAERKRLKENDFWVWFDYRDQKIFSRKISVTKFSDELYFVNVVRLRPTPTRYSLKKFLLRPVLMVTEYIPQ